MANFRTHVIGAAAPSTIAALWLAYDLGLAWPVVAACAVCGAVGGLLPDIDSEQSIPTRLVFTIVAIVSGLLAAGAAYQLLELELELRPGLISPLAIGLVIFVFVRYGVSELFHAVTAHRGVIHSIPMALACGLGLYHVTRLVFPVSMSEALWPGIFLAGGFVAHLLLDEMYSVDLSNARLKRSFGTALKLGSRSNIPGTIALYLADIGMSVPLLIDRL